MEMREYSRGFPSFTMHSNKITLVFRPFLFISLSLFFSQQCTWLYLSRENQLRAVQALGCRDYYAKIRERARMYFFPPNAKWHGSSIPKEC